MDHLSSSTQSNNTCPWKQLLNDLSALIHTWHNSNQEIILMIDANEKENPTTSQWTRFLQSHNLFNAHTMFQHDKPPPTHINGSHQIDYIACSPRVIDSITQAGFLRHDSGPFPSDHRCIFIDLDTLRLLECNTPQPLHAYNKRKIVSKDSKCRKKYQQELGKLCLHDNIPQQIQILLETSKHDPSSIDIEDLNRLDNALTKHMLTAENKCGRPQIAWSPTYRLHHKVVQFWSLRVSLAHHPRASWDILHQLSTNITTLLNDVQVPDPTSSIYNLDPAINWHANLRKAKRMFKKIIDKAKAFRLEFLAQQQAETL